MKKKGNLDLMIVVRLIGGLGNQFFQYALGRHLAEIHKTELKLDISGYSTYRWRNLMNYSLDYFNIKATIASQEEVTRLKYGKRTLLKTIYYFFSSREGKKMLSYNIEKEKFKFDPIILNLPDNVYLEGSWQNSKYFENIRNILKAEFAVKAPLSGLNKELAEKIENINSVSLHIRRGNYVFDQETNKMHGTCTIDYYQKCVNRITEQIKNPHFFVFSDEPQWALENIKLEFPTTYISHNDISNQYEDFRLMALCKHQIISNSTFSWWAAWLNKNSDKIVLAPKEWFTTDIFDVSELVPKEWQKI